MVQASDWDESKFLLRIFKNNFEEYDIKDIRKNEGRWELLINYDLEHSDIYSWYTVTFILNNKGAIND